MNTFLPYESFQHSAECLDRLRLGKQRVENMQILATLTGLSSGWQNHPAVKMWRGHETYLLCYQVAVCNEWRNRGYRDTCLWKSIEMMLGWPSTARPEWLGDDAFHSSHRSNLLRKNADWYGRFGWSESDDIEYVWPVSD